MIVCKVWDADYPWDVRVEKVCHSLMQKHQVHLVCRNSQRRPIYEERDGLHIHRLPMVPKSLGPLNRLLGFPVFFNPVWFFSILKVVLKSRANVILVRDLPLSLTAIVVARLFRIPVILDMAENYPAMLEDFSAGHEHNPKYFIVRNPNLVRLVERITLRAVDHVLVVVEESRRRLLDMGVAPKKISLVMNTPILNRLVENQSGLRPKQSQYPHSLNLIYLGLLERPRGLATAILAIDRVRVELPEVKLLILGTGRDEEYFKSIVNERDLEGNVQFLGWVDYKKALAYILYSDIGLVPHHVTNSWNTTIPNKLFDYMSLGKPVIVSNAVPTERIVNDERCGLVFRDRDSDDLARAIIALSDPRLRDDVGRRGQDAVMTKYNWTWDEGRLLAALESSNQSKVGS
jgi:glycosyltransferase involved in cell wall biosynthesis